MENYFETYGHRDRNDHSLTQAPTISSSYYHNDQYLQPITYNHQSSINLQYPNSFNDRNNQQNQRPQLGDYQYSQPISNQPINNNNYQYDPPEAVDSYYSAAINNSNNPSTNLYCNNLSSQVINDVPIISTVNNSAINYNYQNQSSSISSIDHVDHQQNLEDVALSSGPYNDAASNNVSHNNNNINNNQLYYYGTTTQNRNLSSIDICDKTSNTNYYVNNNYYGMSTPASAPAPVTAVSNQGIISIDEDRFYDQSSANQSLNTHSIDFDLQQNQSDHQKASHPYNYSQLCALNSTKEIYSKSSVYIDYVDPQQEHQYPVSSITSTVLPINKAPDMTTSSFCHHHRQEHDLTIMPIHGPSGYDNQNNYQAHHQQSQQYNYYNNDNYDYYNNKSTSGSHSNSELKSVERQNNIIFSATNDNQNSMATSYHHHNDRKLVTLTLERMSISTTSEELRDRLLVKQSLNKTSSNSSVWSSAGICHNGLDSSAPSDNYPISGNSIINQLNNDLRSSIDPRVCSTSSAYIDETARLIKSTAKRNFTDTTDVHANTNKYKHTGIGKSLRESLKPNGNNRKMPAASKLKQKCILSLRQYNSVQPDKLQTIIDNSSQSTNQDQHRANQCYICGRDYARPSTLKTHLRTHTNERPFRCKICYKTFSQAANLTAHNRIHTGERPFSCPICSRKFSQSSSVITHLRTHSGERPYRCTSCSKTFSDSSTLTKHCRIHSGEKPYQCAHCSLNFSQSGNLSRHLKLHLQSAAIHCKEDGVSSKNINNNNINNSTNDSGIGNIAMK